MGVINECAKFVGARLATMVIEVGGVFLTVNLIGQDAMIGKLETQVIVIVGNYFISKFFVFKD
jgi:putative flippase GtrA